MIRKFLDLSTAHLSPATLERFNGLPPDRLPFAGGPTDYGWFAYAHDENCGEGDDAIPEEMFACMTFARAQGCDYILFDCDAEPIEGLPVFDHSKVLEAA